MGNGVRGGFRGGVEGVLEGVRPGGLFFAVEAAENCIIVVLKKGHEVLSFKALR